MDRTKCAIALVAVAGAAVMAMWGAPLAEAQRDPGINQPGAAGNRGVDPGPNQPGAAGNVGRDPGLNQPGAVGNVGYGGSARQVRAVADPGLNQPGAAERGQGPGTQPARPRGQPAEVTARR